MQLLKGMGVMSRTPLKVWAGLKMGLGSRVFPAIMWILNTIQKRSLLLDAFSALYAALHHKHYCKMLLYSDVCWDLDDFQLELYEPATMLSASACLVQLLRECVQQRLRPNPPKDPGRDKMFDYCTEVEMRDIWGRVLKAIDAAAQVNESSHCIL